MWKPRKKPKSSNLYNGLKVGQAEDWVSSSHERIAPTPRYIARRRMSKPSNLFSSSGSEIPRRRRSTRSDWNSVAREIETVVFGESDEDDEDNMDREGIPAARIRNSRRNSLSRSDPDRSGMRLGRWRRKPPSQQSISNLRRTVPRTHFAYNLFDEPARRQTVSSSTSVIYGQKYFKESLFRPISMLLSVLSVALLLVRIATNLLTSIVGTILVILLAIICWHKALTQPFLVLQLLQASPVLFWAFLGAVVCALYSLLHHRFDPHGEDEGTYNDFVLLWGLVRGAFYGLEVGCVWLIIFGDHLNPSRLTKSLLLCVWRPTSNEADGLVSFDSKDEATQKNHQCAICIDSIDDKAVACILLPCSHSFHEECARHWLTIRRTCPVCRVQVLGTNSSCD